MSDLTEPSFAVPTTCTLQLEHLGVIRATGSDAAAFLQGQLTQDVLTLGVGQSRLAAFCSAKGRMLASFWVLKRSDETGQPEFLLICSRDILAPTLKRLSMFVLRAKVKMTDATGDFRIFGAVGQPPMAPLLGFDMITLPTGAASTPDDGGAAGRWLMVAARVPGVSTPTPTSQPMALDHWHWLDVQSGVAMITQPTVDAFVPQMLNYESVGGVNFKKGCYPGQEVVARSQFRGTLKRRAYLIHGDAAMTAGEPLFSPLDTDQACGSVVQAAPAPQGGYDAVASMQVAAAQTGALTLGSPMGDALQLMPLPYVLLDDV